MYKCLRKGGEKKRGGRKHRCFKSLCGVSLTLGSSATNWISSLTRVWSPDNRWEPEHPSCIKHPRHPEHPHPCRAVSYRPLFLYLPSLPRVPSYPPFLFPLRHYIPLSISAQNPTPAKRPRKRASATVISPSMARNIDPCTPSPSRVTLMRRRLSLLIAKYH